MIIKQYFPDLHKILINWTKNSRGFPLLITNFGKTEWHWLKTEMLDCLFNRPSSLSEKSIWQANYPEIQILEREEKKRTIEVKNTRIFINNLALTPQNLPSKVGFIPQAGNMTVQSQNALLKTLEEPRKDVFIILMAESRNRLLPTILSRCLTYNFVIKSNAVIKNFLNEYFPDLSNSDKEKIILWTEKNIGRTKDMAENLDYWEDIHRLFDKIKIAKLTTRLKEGPAWHQGNNARIADFLYLAKINAQEELRAAMQNRNFPQIKKPTQNLSRLIECFNQLASSGGTSPKVLFDNFVINI